jgi:hypothetical protein
MRNPESIQQPLCHRRLTAAGRSNYMNKIYILASTLSTVTTRRKSMHQIKAWP